LNLRQFRKEDPDVSLTPLIDVVFLLLIFFMVSTSFNRESEISVDLPEANVETVETDDKPIELTINEQGVYFINQRRVVNTQRITLVKALRIATSENDAPALIISADAKTPHQAVITAMDVARQLGILRLSIATKESAGSN